MCVEEYKDSNYSLTWDNTEKKVPESCREQYTWLPEVTRLCGPESAEPGLHPTCTAHALKYFSTLPVVQHSRALVDSHRLKIKMSQDGSPTKKARISDDERKAQEDVWREVFRIFDKDNNGSVSASEVGMLLRGLDMNPSERDIVDMIQKIDRNGTGQIEWEEFVDFMHHLKRSTNQEQMEEMLRAFKLFDYNNDDHIDASELRRVVTSMGDKLTPEEADQMIKVADIDRDGKINYKEFAKFIFAPCL